MGGLINYNTLVVLIGTASLGAVAGAVGTFAVLKRRALTGDALAHAALPGLCIAFLAYGERNTSVMLLGALVSGVIGIATIAALRRWTRTKEDASIGIVLSVFFGAGIVLSRMIQNRAGGGSKAGLDSYILGTTAGMTRGDVLLIIAAAVLCLAVVVLLYKELKLVAFDPGFGRAQGWPVLLLDLAMMSLVAITVVIGLPSVGVVLVAAMLIIPAIAARFWTERLRTMLILSALLGVVVGVGGTALSAQFSKLPTGAVIVLIGALVFLVSLLFAPRRGFITRRIAEREFAEDLLDRRLLLQLYETWEQQGNLGSELATRHASAWPAGSLAAALIAARRRGELVMNDRGEYEFTPLGLERARTATREYRIWERFLTEYADQASGLDHIPGEPISDSLPLDVSDAILRQLAQEGRLPPRTEVGTT